MLGMRILSLFKDLEIIMYFYVLYMNYICMIILILFLLVKIFIKLYIENFF